MQQPNQDSQRPLYVDLDDTLIASDVTAEACFRLIRQRPETIWRLPVGLLFGRSALKERLSRDFPFEVEALLYRAEVVDYLHAQRDAGRRIILATASHERGAHAIAKHLGLFDHVIASNATTNRKGQAKLTAIREDLQGAENREAGTGDEGGNSGAGGFDYIGDAWADLPIWQAAGRAMVVNPSGRLRRAITARVPIHHEFHDDVTSALPPLLQAMRPLQWSKNLLLAVPMIVGHQIHLANLLLVLAGFLCFSLAASAMYLVNDLLDVEHDRRHPSKKHRPLACGRLKMSTAAAASPVLLLAAIVIGGIFLPLNFMALLLAYLALTNAYSVWLKRKLLVDVICLAALYTLRLMAGGAAVDIMPSFWLLAFSMFLFISLAFAKRYTELVRMRDLQREVAGGRGYSIEDIDMLRILGPISGYLAVMVFCLYVNSPTVTMLYGQGQPQVLWLICPLILYWVSRVWIVAARGMLDDDPVVFAIRDWHSYAAGALAAIFMLLAKWM